MFRRILGSLATIAMVVGLMAGTQACKNTDTTDPTFTIGGTATNLVGTLTLTLNGSESLALSADGTFTFATALPDKVPFTVQVLTAPAGQTCTVTNGTGVIAAAAVTNVTVTCAGYHVSGTATNISGPITITLNGSESIILAAADVFAFTSGLADGAHYTVQVIKTPEGRRCTVTNGTGTIATADATTVNVDCAGYVVGEQTGFLLGGTVTNLAGSGLVLTVNGTQNVTVDANDTGSDPFTFAAPIVNGSLYNVTVATQPSNPAGICTVSGGTGTILDGNVSDVSVTCVNGNGKILAGAGGHTIKAKGGNGGNGDGGSGRKVSIINSAATSDVQVLKKGMVNTTFAIPAYAGVPNYTPDLGDNPCVISDTEDPTYIDVNDVDENSSWQINGYVTDGCDGGDGTVTGLHVLAGATLIVNSMTGDYDYWAQMNFNNDVWIEGTLQANYRSESDYYTYDSESSADLTIYASNIVTAAGALITATGADDDEGSGGNGGLVDLNAVSLIINQGDIDTSGGDGADGNGGNGGYVNLYSGEWSVYNTGAITANGGTGTFGTGGKAGGIDINADFNAFNSGALTSRGGDGDTGGNGRHVEITGWGSTANTGAIDTSGGEGLEGNGGYGRHVTIYSGNYSVYNTGNITANGGIADDGCGGDGGYKIELRADSEEGGSGGVYNSGNLSTRGGDGSTWAGDAGWINLSADFMGTVISSGALNASGGDSTDSANGGRPNTISLYTNVGTIRVSGSITAKAGNGGPNGGNGGGYENWWTVRLESYVDNYSDAPGAASGGIYSSADIDASGGDALDGSGSSARQIRVRAYCNCDGYDYPGESPIYFVGYDTIDTSGGDSLYSGGSADNIDIETDNSDGAYDYNSTYFGPGNVVNEANLVAQGGDSSLGGEGSGSGGSGGSIYLSTYLTDSCGDATEPTPPYDASVTNSGAIDVQGGDGTDNTAGNGGGIYMYAYTLLVNTGAMDASGGSSVTGNGGYCAGDGSDIDLVTEGTLVNEADLTCNGGNTATASASSPGGSIYLTARTLTHSGVLTSNGGTASLGDGNGADGGYIELDYSSEESPDVTGSASVAGGAGHGSGYDGSFGGVQVGGFGLLPDSNGQVSFDVVLP